MNTWRNRIVGEADEPPDQLLANPANFRTHPSNQAEALVGVLSDVGWVQRIIVNQRTGHVVDGHLRVAEALKAGAPTVPVLYVDLSEDEERLILATLDPLSALAGTDAAALDALLRDVTTDSPAVAAMLDALAQEAGVVPGVEPGAGNTEDIEPDEAGEIPELLAPFPWFGGKARVASRIWARFGEIDNYVEPFCGSAAVLLAAPTPSRIVTLNDADGFIANFWRALAAAPDEVAQWLDWPVNENDLFARHIWLVRQERDLVRRLEAEPDYYDPKVAGWWCWGACAWIGTGWCSGDGPWTVDGDGFAVRDAGRGVNRQLPHLGNAGQGVCAEISTHLRGYMGRLADALRTARVTCGDWTRVVTPAVTTRHGVTAVLLDPPYGEGAQEYSAGGNADGQIAANVWAWAAEHGNDPLLRIAVCGYDDGRALPPGWSAMRWTARKGYQATDGDSADNPAREVVWFSPHCEVPE